MDKPILTDSRLILGHSSQVFFVYLGNYDSIRNLFPRGNGSKSSYNFIILTIKTLAEGH